VAGPPAAPAGLTGGEARAAALHLTAVVAEHLDPEHYPALTAVHAEEDTRPADGDTLPFELGFGVDRFLDGVEARVRSRRQV
jgi:hypothetical protein